MVAAIRNGLVAISRRNRIKVDASYIRRTTPRSTEHPTATTPRQGSQHQSHKRRTQGQTKSTKSAPLAAPLATRCK